MSNSAKSNFLYFMLAELPGIEYVEYVDIYKIRAFWLSNSHT